MAAPAVSTIGTGTGFPRPPSRDEIGQQVSAAQKALVELKRRQEELEHERSQLEESRRRRIEYEQGREEMLAHLTRGVGLLAEAENTARRDAEQLARTVTDLRLALDKVSALHEENWTAENYTTELTRALTTIENARMEWNSAQVKWAILSGNAPATAPAKDAAGPFSHLMEEKSPGDLARLGLALTWPVAVAVLAVGLVLAVVLSRS